MEHRFLPRYSFSNFIIKKNYNVTLKELHRSYNILVTTPFKHFPFRSILKRNTEITWCRLIKVTLQP